MSNIIKNIKSFYTMDNHGNKGFELEIKIEKDRSYLAVFDDGVTIKEAAFKLRQLAASIERHNQ